MGHLTCLSLIDMEPKSPHQPLVGVYYSYFYMRVHQWRGNAVRLFRPLVIIVSLLLLCLLVLSQIRFSSVLASNPQQPAATTPQVSQPHLLQLDNRLPVQTFTATNNFN